MPRRTIFQSRKSRTRRGNTSVRRLLERVLLIDAFSGELSKDVRTPIVNAPASAPDAYPISGLTFLLVPKQAKDPNKAAAVKGFVQYIITGGQDPAEQLHHAKIPASLQQIDQELLQQVPGGS